MSQLHFAAHCEQENLGQHNRHVKQHGVGAIPRSTTKKTALSDVKNILSQRTVNSAKKSVTFDRKSNIFKENSIDAFDKKNKIQKKQIKKDVKKSQAQDLSILTSNETVIQEAHEGVDEPVCSFCSKHEDDLADFMLKPISLTKIEIDKLALEWEKPPVVGLDDIRKFEIPDIIPCELDPVLGSDWLSFGCELDELDISLLNDIPVVESIFDVDSCEE